jgi:hypothetical protein
VKPLGRFTRGVVFERNSEKVGKVGNEKVENEKVGTRAWEVGKKAHRQVGNLIGRWVGCGFGRDWDFYFTCALGTGLTLVYYTPFTYQPKFNHETY